MISLININLFTTTLKEMQLLLSDLGKYEVIQTVTCTIVAKPNVGEGQKQFTR